MTRTDGDDALDAREISRFVAPLKMAEQCRDELVRWSDMRTDFHVAVSQCTGGERHFFTFRGSGNAHGFRKLRVEATV